MRLFSANDIMQQRWMLDYSSDMYEKSFKVQIIRHLQKFDPLIVRKYGISVRKAFHVVMVQMPVLLRWYQMNAATTGFHDDKWIKNEGLIHDFYRVMLLCDKSMLGQISYEFQLTLSVSIARLATFINQSDRSNYVLHDRFLLQEELWTQWTKSKSADNASYAAQLNRLSVETLAEVLGEDLEDKAMEVVVDITTRDKTRIHIVRFSKNYEIYENDVLQFPVASSAEVIDWLATKLEQTPNIDSE